jgi:hypothetical protein
MTELHLSDERLSAYLDEMDDVAPLGAPELQPHLAQCARCNDRLAALRSAGRLVGAPVVRVAPEVRAQAVAVAVHAAREQSGPVHAERDVEQARKIRWYRRPQVLAGAAAAVVVLSLGVAVPLTLSGQSSSNSTAGSRIPTSTEHRGSAGFSPESGGLAAGSSPVAVEDLGRVSSMKQVLSRLHDVGIPSSSSGPARLLYNDEATSRYAGCVATTRRAARAGDYGPGIVASATYQGRASLVMEFWPTVSKPEAGKTVVAVTTTNGCRLLARTTT